MNEPAVLNPMFKGYRYHFTGLHHDAMGFPTEEIETCRKLIERLFNKVNDFPEEYESYEEFMLEDADFLLIAYGSVSLAAKETIKQLRNEGIKAGLFRPITLWPSPAKRIKHWTDKIKDVLVVELNQGQYYEEIQRAACRHDIHGQFKVNGRAISPYEITEKIKEIRG
jgi:2-oxoglutarate ferredoxin oxidoreductase subunit alpha